jgi:histone deacetylase complex regulatory component SIN3
MKEFKAGTLDEPGLVVRVEELFVGKEDLIRGLDKFLSPRYREAIGSRGPVEYNTAIAYINKIKVGKHLCGQDNMLTMYQSTFTAKPHIYKEFLETLQRYQRESLPIQGVYGEVTTLFEDYPHLIEDFKAFLPDSALEASRLANERGATVTTSEDESSTGEEESADEDESFDEEESISDENAASPITELLG